MGHSEDKVFNLYSLLFQKYSSHSKLESTKPIPQVHQIDWAVDKKDSNRSETCRNSMQGLHLITDDRGRKPFSFNSSCEQ